jgi:nuclear pore complex protein Nup93
MANVIKSLNESRMQSRRPNLLTALSEAILSQGSDSRSVQLADALRIITNHIIDEDGDSDAIAPRASRVEYIERKGLKKIRTQICEGSQRFLENLAWGVVVSEVSQHPQEARVGGIPSVVHRVRGFLNIRFKEGTKWNSDLTVRQL